MLSKNATAIKTLYEAAGKGEMETVFEQLDAEIVVYEQESLPVENTYRGRDGFQKLFADLLNVWADFNFTLEEVYDAGDLIVAVVRLRGQSKKSGEKLDMPMIELWKMKNGRAVECRSIVWDTARYLEIVG